MRNLVSVLKQSITLSLQNIISNKMRTFLTTLGIIIGVTAVIALITIVNGVIGYMMGEFSSLGAGTLNVSIQGTPLKKGLTDTDLERLKALDNVAGITPEISTTLTGARRGGEMVKKVSVSGYSEAYFRKNESLVTVGRPLTKVDMDNESYVCIIDNDLAKELFAGENPIGQTVILGNISYTVVGLEGKNDDLMDSMSRMGNSIDGSAIIPYTTAKKVTGTDVIKNLEIYIADTNATDTLSENVKNVLYQAFNQRNDCYNVFSMDSLIDTMNSMMNTMTYMLAGIASISLLVGGIGIMNMMLVSVTERTKEIGLRKAMGATPGRIQLQFLFEALVLSLLGGIIGVILGLLISLAAAILLNTDFLFSPSAVILGISFSTSVGLIFGWMPAKKASQLSPIDALRSE